MNSHLQAKASTIIYGFCRRFRYCEPYPEGVRISAVMNLRNIWKRIPAEGLASG